MVFKFEINDRKYWISANIDGYRWMSQNGSCGIVCPTILACQQNAIDTVNRLIEQERQEKDWEEEKYGTYEEQVAAFWKSERGC